MEESIGFGEEPKEGRALIKRESEREHLWIERARERQTGGEHQVGETNQLPLAGLLFRNIISRKTATARGVSYCTNEGKQTRLQVPKWVNKRGSDSELSLIHI